MSSPSPSVCGLGGRLTRVARLPSSERPAAAPAYKSQVRCQRAISFAKKETIWATLIQLEKEKFPRSAETGDAGSTSLRDAAGSECPRRTASGRSPRRARSRQGSSALSRLARGPGCTPAGSAPPARAAAPPLERGWRGRNRLPRGDGAWRSEGEGVPEPSPARLGRRLQPPGGKRGRRERGSASRRSSRLPPSPPRSRWLSKWAHCSSLHLAFPGETCTNLELFRASECTTSPSARRPRPAPGRPIARRLGAAGQRRALPESVGASVAQRQPGLRAARPGRHARGWGTRRPRSPRPGRRQLVSTGPSGEEVLAGGPAPHGRVSGEKNRGARRKWRWGEPQ